MEKDMSLLDLEMVNCTIMDKTTTPTEYGGVKTTWTDGAPIKAAFAYSDSVQARLASVQGVTDLYTVITRKNVVLQENDVIRRNTDGKVFRITTDGKDNRTPESAPLDARAVRAREWVIPNE